MFAVKKEWIDREPGIELVALRHQCSALAGTPDWDAGDEEFLVLKPRRGTDPVQRTATVMLPRGLEGAEPYLFHYFFVVVQGGHERMGPVFTEEVAARPVEYRDHQGRFTHLSVAWSVGDKSTPNYAALTLVGAPPGPAARARHPRDTAAARSIFRDYFDVVAGLPVPRAFVGSVWGIRGQPVHYIFHLSRLGAPRPSDEAEEWDTRGGEMYTLTI